MTRFGLRCMAISLSLCLPEATAQDYFPLGKEGSRWTYGGFPREDARLVTMAEIETAEEREGSAVETAMASVVSVGLFSGALFYSLRNKSRSERPILAPVCSSAAIG